MTRVLLILPYLLELLLLIHIIKTGRSYTWVWLLFLVPYVSGIAYVILCVIPDLISGPSNRVGGGSLIDEVFPGIKIKKLEQTVRNSSTTANIVELADAYADAGNYDKAIELYKGCLEGLYKHDAGIQFKLMSALYEKGKTDEAKEILKDYKKHTEFTLKRQYILEMLLNEDYEKMSDKFFSDADFEIGWQLARCYAKDGRKEEIKKIVDEMKDDRKRFAVYRKGVNNKFYRLTKRLM